MKKILLVLTAFLSLGICLGCSAINSSKGSLTEITYQEFAEKIKNKESFVIYVGSATCSHCADFKPTLEEVISENDLSVYYIDRSKLTDSQSTAVTKKVALEGTPTLCNIIEGRADNDNNLIGAKDKDATVEFFKTAGYIE